MATTTDPTVRPDAGFSLIEVLIAMIILAVGLLALESLGIGAARTVHRAQVQSTYTATAADLMEKTLLRIDQAPTGTIADTAYTGSGGERVWRTASSAAMAGTTRTGGGTMNLWTITVRVLPPSTNLGVLSAADSVRLTNNVIR